MSDLVGLVAILRGAYSGELAAGLAYRGHWRSLRDPADRARIRQIEEDEWHHRDLVGGLLARLGSEPSSERERRARAIGRTLGFLCHVVGWLVPMYGAGRLERGNIVEYETAARLAAQAGWQDFVDCLLGMAEVEWDHEQYFRSRVAAHRLARWLPIWPAAPPRREIRDSFARETSGAGTTTAASLPPPAGDPALVSGPDTRHR
jgi:hypothetical protein